MISWFRKFRRPPRPAKENPGRGHNVRVDFSNAQRKWEESVDLANLLATTLKGTGYKAVCIDDAVELDDFLLLPQVVSVEPMENSGVKTSTTIHVAHASLPRGGVFEYQSSSGTDLQESFVTGFKGWADLDLPVFLDSLQARATLCMVAEAQPGSEPSAPLPKDRRVLFGPPSQMVQNTAPVADDHEFCPCCLFTRSIGAFDELLRGEDFYGVRLFVSRDTQGVIRADCRVNGVEHSAGAEALIRYAQSWPDRGYEYRKQYVGIQTRAATS